MPNSNYAKGSREERAVCRLLRGQGFSVVRSAGSKGPFDIIAWNEEAIRFIQIKYGSSGIETDLERMSHIQVPAGGTKELWHRERYERTWHVTMVNTRTSSTSTANAEV